MPVYVPAETLRWSMREVLQPYNWIHQLQNQAVCCYHILYVQKLIPLQQTMNDLVTRVWELGKEIDDLPEGDKEWGVTRARINNLERQRELKRELLRELRWFKIDLKEFTTRSSVRLTN